MACNIYQKNLSSFHEFRDFIFENYYKQIGFAKENSYYSIRHQKKRDLKLFATKLMEKIPDPSNTKEHYNSFLKRKNTKSVKRSKIITHQLKAIEKPKIVDIKSITKEHPKISHKLSKTIRQAERFLK